MSLLYWFLRIFFKLCDHLQINDVKDDISALREDIKNRFTKWYNHAERLAAKVSCLTLTRIMSININYGHVLGNYIGYRHTKYYH